jgi:hypothetical protein
MNFWSVAPQLCTRAWFAPPEHPDAQAQRNSVAAITLSRRKTHRTSA